MDTQRPKMSRRGLLGATAATATSSLFTSPGRTQTAIPPAAVRGVKAMTFDIQGTLFDYYQPFNRVSTALAQRKGLALDWAGFLTGWNAGAVSIILAITAGKRPWIPPGRVLRDALDNLLTARGWANQLDDTDRLDLMSVWREMTPWPDSVEGVSRLKRKVTVAALSNAGMAAVVATAKRGGLAFDAVLSGELVRAYKPSPDVYRAAAAYLGFPPDEIMMVAAHKFDLEAAKAVGFRTAYVPRPFETGPETRVDRWPETYIDIVVTDLVELSKEMEAV